MALVAIKPSPDVKEGIWGALDLLGDLTSLLKGKYVAIKPNDTWATARSKTACTQADTVEAVIQYVKKYQPSRIVVTGGAGAAETDEVFSLMGIDKVIRKEDLEFFDHNRPPFVRVDLDYGPQAQVIVNPKVFEYETLISLAQHKVHFEARITLTMKNIAMSFPAADYYGHPRSAELHQNRFYADIHGFIAGMCQKFPIDLGIIVGHPAMVGRGPIGGLTFDSNLTIASRDFVAADYIGARILGISRVKHLEEAADLGLGTASLKEIEFTGMTLEEAIKVFQRRKEMVTSYRYHSPSKLYSHQ